MSGEMSGEMSGDASRDAVNDRARAPLRLRLSREMGRLAIRHGGLAVFDATQWTNRGYLFASSDPRAVRALWHALTCICGHPDVRGRLRASAGKKLGRIRPIVVARYPEALSP